jgi:hypothetical protein
MGGNPQIQRRARELVARAVAAGTLTRPAACESCAAPGPVIGHHRDYDRPLDVAWLCRACHAREHAPPAQRRAERELLANPARSNRLIAELAGVEHHAVARARIRLEAAGSIEPAAARVQRYPNGPRAFGAAQRAVALLGPAATTREVMALSGVCREAAWHARRYPRSGWQPQADAAAAVDAVRVARAYAPPPAPDAWCCELAWAGGGWQHDRACPLRLAAR